MNSSFTSWSTQLKTFNYVQRRKIDLIRIIWLDLIWQQVDAREYWKTYWLLNIINPSNLELLLAQCKNNTVMIVIKYKQYVKSKSNCL